MKRKILGEITSSLKCLDIRLNKKLNWNLYNNDLAVKVSKINVIKDKICVDKNAL